MERLLACLSLLTIAASAQSTFSPARPPAIPLAVRSPYLSAWLPAGNNGPNSGLLPGTWPTFWTGATETLGWTGFVRVDNATYTWMGNPMERPTLANQTGFSYTSTCSTFTFNVADLVSMNVTFMSPVTPDDMLRQSAPISYMDVRVWSQDGAEHDVQIYTDVSAEWVSGNRSQIAQWQYGSTNGNASSVAYHQFWRQTQEEFTEDSQQAAWGTWYYATSQDENLTHLSGADVDVRAQFVSNGALNNTQDPNFRAINDDYVVFGFAIDVGQVKTEFASSVFSLFYAQNNIVLFNDGQGNQSVPSFWKSQYEDEIDALEFFHNDFDNVGGLATVLDRKVASDSFVAGGQDYLTLTSLAVRQAWGSMQMSGTPDRPYLFLKEISSNGDAQTVDVLFPAMPIILYMAPSWLKLLLDPLYINQEAGEWPEMYALHDLGTYPQLVGHPNGNAEAMPLEESANMLIMTLAYAQRTGDTGYLNTHYSILKQWTNYLVNDSLIPANQISTDDFAGSLANQTNLAIKGMIGIQAMAIVANFTGHAQDEANFTNIALDYISQWQDFGIADEASPPHTTLSYGQNATWGLLYNLYADSLLQTKLVPTSVYEMQSSFYPTVMQTYGVPLDTRHNYTKSDWEMWTAAITDEQTRNVFISAIAKWINDTPTNAPATDLYDVSDGNFPANIQFRARPVVGGWFSLLALNETGIPS